ncbi:MAG: hypothetical protein K2Q12_08540 [Rickettsiales bacterium]|nr:hypothetical protein [Rickettsiales bacterium]
MLYHWNSPASLLHHVEMLPGRKTPQAVIYAPENADASTLRNLNERLQARGFLTNADEVNGKPALRVQKFGDRESLFTALSQLGAVDGTPITQFTPLDTLAHKSSKEKLNEVLLPITGVGYLIGDALMALSGMLRKDWAEAATGAIWGSSGAVLAGFGRSDADMQLGILYRQLGEHLKHEGIEVPRTERQLLDALARDHGLLTKTAEFFNKNGADIHHVVQALGGLTLLKAGLNQRQDNPLKMFQGISVAFGQSMGLMPEKEKPATSRPQAYGTPATVSYASAPANDESATPQQNTALLPPEPDHRGAFTRVVDWFNTKPTRYAGVFSGANNVLGVIGAIMHERPKVNARNDVENLEKGYVPRIARMKQELEAAEQALASGANATQLALRDTARQALKAEEAAYAALKKSVITNFSHQPTSGKIMGIHAWQVSVATAVVYIVTNALYSLCSKNGTLDLEKLGQVEDIYATTANIAMHQPEAFRKPLIDRVSSFLAQQSQLHATADQIAQRITHKLEALSKNPWVERVANHAANDQAQQGAIGA